MNTNGLLSMILALLASMVTLTGCQSAEPNVTVSSTEPQPSISETKENTVEDFFSEAEIDDVSFEDAVAASNCVVLAKCLSYNEFDEYTDYCFSLIDTYKGKVDDTFYVRWSTYDSTQDTVPFSEKEDYIMPLIYVNSVYFDYPVYNVYSHMTLHCSGENISSVSVGDTVINSDTSEIKVDSIASYVASVSDTSEKMFKDYITSAALNDIVSQSDYIVKAKITGEPNRTGEDRGIYPCEITQQIKGDIADSFEAVFFYDSVEIGNEYYFFLTKPDSTSRFYIVSSKDSISDANDKAVINALENSGIM